jgi:predicted acylesterase/phospholipase RssA
MLGTIPLVRFFSNHGHGQWADQTISHILPLLLLCLVLGACASRPDSAVGDVNLARVAKVNTNAPDGRPLTGASQGAPVVQTVGSLQNILVLSGGGSHGAFGAGVLVGWSEIGARPQFDVVTGVSTGALMATFAFLGPAYDAKLRQVYTSLDDKDVYKNRGLAGLFKGAIYNQAPLMKIIEAEIDDAILSEVARQHALGRRLYVATTNLDTGVQVTWDMGKIASSTSPEKVVLFRQILAASSAFPGLFKPVYIKSTDETPALHVDGGLHSAVLFHSFMIPTDRKGQSVWAIVNGKINYVRADGPADANVQNLVPRSVSEMLRAIMDDSIYRTYVRAHNGNAAFHLAYMPDKAPDTDPMKFSPLEMSQLFEAGRSFARTNAWSSEPPRLEALDRLR